MRPTLREFIDQKKSTNHLNENASFDDALERISAVNEGITFIVDDQHKLVGVLSDGDIRRHMNQNPDFRALPLSRLMTKNPICMAIGDDFDNVLSVMKKHKINALAIVDHDNVYLGSITLHETLRYFSPERVYIKDSEQVTDENLERHVSRYRFAANFIPRGAHVLDCACGSGYGSEIIFRQAAAVTGVDHSKEAIDYARAHYAHTGMTFIREKIEHLTFPREHFDAIISFETIEHITETNCRIYLEKSATWIKAGGIFIVSSPMLRYKDNEPYVTNPYHINEMAKPHLLDMFEKTFPGFIIHYYHQKQDVFLPLSDEHTGFMVAVGRKLS